jgi:hypothetical protein
MLFTAKEGSISHYGHVIYIQQDYALKFVPQQIAHCSVLLEDVEVCFIISDNNIKHASSVWGYCGSSDRWIKQQLQAPVYFPGSLFLRDETIGEGDIVRLEGSDTWNIFYDPETFWVCIGDATPIRDGIAVEFATNCVALLLENNLRALWIKPIFQ